MSMSEQKKEYKQRQLKQLEEHAAEINASIIPDIPGHVRTDGPRRQHSAEVRNRELHLTEI